MISRENTDDFFNRYASTINNALFGDAFDVNAITDSFSEIVVSAKPAGMEVGKNDADFGSAVAEGIAFYKQIGILSMNIVSKEITVLNPWHAIAKINWSFFYSKGELSGEIPFEVVYMVQSRNEAITIFAYVTDDEQKVLSDHGLIAPAESYNVNPSNFP
jgi:hypothetical protein